MNVVIKFEFFDRWMKTTVEANSIPEAVQIVKDRLHILSAEPEPPFIDFFNNLINGTNRHH